MELPSSPCSEIWEGSNVYSRKVNAVTKKDAYPIGMIEGILGRLHDSKFITSLDLKDAFWQIGLEKAFRDKTAFTVPERPLYQFKVMPFGMEELPVPMTSKQLLWVLGMTGWYRRFVAEYSSFSSPLTDLLKGSRGPKGFNSNEEAQQFFDTLKRKLIEDPRWSTQILRSVSTSSVMKVR